ncbi:hypothetical protein ABFX02_07G033400 [Erythranthe guttata]
MAQKQASMGLAVIFAAMIWGCVKAQSNDCTNVLISMSPCLNYISGNSSAPSTSCCTQLRTVVGAQPQCLCQILNGGAANLGLNINQTQAVALPGACSVDVSTSKCTAASPSASPGSAPDSPDANTDGSKTTGDGSSDASSNKFGVSVLFFVLFVASYVFSV